MFYYSLKFGLYEGDKIDKEDVELTQKQYESFVGKKLQMVDGVLSEVPMTDEELLKSINIWYEAEVAKLTKGVPNTEISTWDKQESEARTYLTDANALTPFIDNLVQARGITKEYLVNKIIEKADAYAIALGTLTGERQKKEDEL